MATARCFWFITTTSIFYRCSSSRCKFSDKLRNTMQTLNTVQQLRDIFNVVQEISNQRLSFCLLAARRTLRNWVGPESFDDALLAEPENAERGEALRSS